MGADDGADAVDDDFLHAVAALDLVGHELGVLQTGTVADIHGLGRGVLGQLADLVRQRQQRCLAAPGLGDVDEVPFVVHVHHRLDLEHGAHQRGGGGHAAALFQEEQVVDGEPVALAQLVLLRPVPDLLDGLSVQPQLGRLRDQHALTQRGAEGVHHEDLPVGELCGQLVAGDLEGVIGGGKAGGEGQYQHVPALLQDRLQHLSGLTDVDGVGGGHLALLLPVIELLRTHLPVVGVVVICLIAHDEGQGRNVQLQLPDQLVGQVAGRVGDNNEVVHGGFLQRNILSARHAPMLTFSCPCPAGRSCPPAGP